MRIISASVNVSHILANFIADIEFQSNCWVTVPIGSSKYGPVRSINNFVGKVVKLLLAIIAAISY